MSIDVKIGDGRGSGNYAKVNGEGELNVVVHPHPPRDEVESPLPFRQFFTDNGASNGSEDMAVDGSTTPQDFWINAQPDKDIYIKTCAIVISDAGAVLNEFGNLSALTNGVDFCWQSRELGTTMIAEGLKTNWEFIRLSNGNPAFGDGAAAFRANNISGVSEGYIPVLDFASIFGMPWGIRLRKGTQDKLIWTVNDNISTVDQFDIIGYGIEF